MKHLVYIPPFPDLLQDQLRAFHRKWDTQQKDILTHCRRELMHSVWKFLLNDNFIHAYHYGMVVWCHNKVEQCIYPRIFTYSADYPEKCTAHFSLSAHFQAHYSVRVLLATIREQGLCPCPQCLIPKAILDQLSHIVDMKKQIDKPHKYLVDAVNNARKAIYDLGKPIGGVAVQRLLKGTSSVPTAVCPHSVLCRFFVLTTSYFVECLY